MGDGCEGVWVGARRRGGGFETFKMWILRLRSKVGNRGVETLAF